MRQTVPEALDDALGKISHGSENCRKGCLRIANGFLQEITKPDQIVQ